MPTIADVMAYLDQFAPTSTAAEWDNVGLILGDRSAPVKRILTCLTVTPEVVQEAVSTNANLIVTHHPMLFRPVQKLTDVASEGRMVLALLKVGIAVYSPHTAFDNCVGGINDLLAQKLGLIEVTCLRPYEACRKCKIVVFVPDADLAKVSDAMFAAGAGLIGQYRECSFRVSGKGTFFGSEGTNPTLGKKGRREEVSELRLEVVCPEANLEAAIAAMRKAHSYEEPAFDVHPLRADRGPGGEGRIGRLAEPVALGDFANRVRAGLNSGPVQIVGDLAKPISKVALACGAAGEFWKDAIRERADVFLTGEMRFHDYLSAQSGNISLVLPGHYATERLGVTMLAQQLAKQWPELKVCSSDSESDPVRWV
jgi:dinuclear metal center YbgI/SA1388 family protein